MVSIFNLTFLQTTAVCVLVLVLVCTVFVLVLVLVCTVSVLVLVLVCTVSVLVLVLVMVWPVFERRHPHCLVKCEYKLSCGELHSRYILGAAQQIDIIPLLVYYVIFVIGKLLEMNSNM